jgi:tetratricopeptide (TPR) repeat protein
MARQDTTTLLLRVFWLSAVMLGFGSSGVAYAEQGLPPNCGSLETHFGPFDYRVNKDKLPIVERYHFPPELERLAPNAANPGGNLTYTLRAFPNHHRALMTLIRYGEEQHGPRPRNLPFSVECFMLRAEVFAPDDPMVKLITGLYYLKQGKAKVAIERLEEAEKLGSANPNLYYNLGLAYLDVGDKEKALENAHKAYAEGFPLPGLKNRLKRVGAWQDPAPRKADPAPEKAESAPPASAAQ